MVGVFGLLAAATTAWASPLAAGAFAAGGGASVFEQPQEFAIRAGLTALILLVALTFAPRLASHVSAAPSQARLGPEAAALPSGMQSEAQPGEHAVARRHGLGRWLGAVTVASIWLAAVAAILVIWLWGHSGFLPDNPRAILTGAGYILTRVAISLLVVAVTLALARAVDTGIERGLERGRVNKNLLVLAGHAMYVATLIAGLIVILAVWGVSLVVPVTLIGVVTVALSFALQDILKNVVAGVYLLIERPFVIGDYIAVDTYTGTIEDILIRVTRLRTTDGQLILIPNATLFTSPVVNKSYYERRRVSLALTLPEGGADGVAAAQDHILAVLESVPGVRGEPAPEVMLRGSSAGTVELRASFWVPTADPRRETTIVSDAIEELRHRLPDAQIAPLGGRPLTA